MERNAAERQLSDRVRELIDLQARFDAENAESNARLKELTNANDKLRAQLADKDHSIAMLQMSISSLETRLGAMAAREYQQLERPLSAAAPAADSDEAAYEALHSIARQLIHDNDQVNTGLSLLH